MSDLNVLVLAAGKGKRMRSRRPKVLHRVLFRPMIDYVLDTAESLNPSSLVVVVGHGEELVREECGARKNVSFVTQEQQLGTGHAVQCAREAIPQRGALLVLCGDTILLCKETLEAAHAAHAKSGA